MELREQTYLHELALLRVSDRTIRRQLVECGEAQIRLKHELEEVSEWQHISDLQKCIRDEKELRLGLCTDEQYVRGVLYTQLQWSKLQSVAFGPWIEQHVDIKNVAVLNPMVIPIEHNSRRRIDQDISEYSASSMQVVADRASDQLIRLQREKHQLTVSVTNLEDSNAQLTEQVMELKCQLEIMQAQLQENQDNATMLRRHVAVEQNKVTKLERSIGLLRAEAGQQLAATSDQRTALEQQVAECMLENHQLRQERDLLLMEHTIINKSLSLKLEQDQTQANVQVEHDKNLKALQDQKLKREEDHMRSLGTAVAEVEQLRVEHKVLQVKYDGAQDLTKQLEAELERLRQLLRDVQEERDNAFKSMGSKSRASPTSSSSSTSEALNRRMESVEQRNEDLLADVHATKNAYNAIVEEASKLQRELLSTTAATDAVLAKKHAPAERPVPTDVSVYNMQIRAGNNTPPIIHKVPLLDIEKAKRIQTDEPKIDPQNKLQVSPAGTTGTSSSGTIPGVRSAMSRSPRSQSHSPASPPLSHRSSSSGTSVSSASPFQEHSYAPYNAYYPHHHTNDRYPPETTHITFGAPSRDKHNARSRQMSLTDAISEIINESPLLNTQLHPPLFNRTLHPHNHGYSPSNMSSSPSEGQSPTYSSPSDRSTSASPSPTVGNGSPHTHTPPDYPHQRFGGGPVIPPMMIPGRGPPRPIPIHTTSPIGGNPVYHASPLPQPDNVFPYLPPPTVSSPRTATGGTTLNHLVHEVSNLKHENDQLSVERKEAITMVHSLLKEKDLTMAMQRLLQDRVNSLQHDLHHVDSLVRNATPPPQPPSPQPQPRPQPVVQQALPVAPTARSNNIHGHSNITVTTPSPSFNVNIHNSSSEIVKSPRGPKITSPPTALTPRNTIHTPVTPRRTATTPTRTTLPSSSRNNVATSFSVSSFLNNNGNTAAMGSATGGTPNSDVRKKLSWHPQQHTFVSPSTDANPRASTMNPKTAHITESHSPQQQHHHHVTVRSGESAPAKQSDSIHHGKDIPVNTYQLQAGSYEQQHTSKRRPA